MDDDEYFDPPFPDEDDEDEMFLSECGMDASGFCQLVGTEYCDWDCQIAEMKRMPRKVGQR